MPVGALDGKSIVVTGASSGIGEPSSARPLTQLGFREGRIGALQDMIECVDSALRVLLSFPSDPAWPWGAEPEREWPVDGKRGGQGRRRTG